MKKIILVVSTILLTFGFVSCDCNTQETTDTATETVSEETVTTTATETITETDTVL